MVLKGLYRTLRTLLVLVLVLPLAVPAVLYVLLSVPAVQNAIGGKAEKELTRLLGTSVSIGRVEFYPFNRLALTDVVIANPDGAGNCLTVGHIGLGISIGESIWNTHPVVSYAEIIDLDAHLSRPTPESPLNISPIIERLQSSSRDSTSTTPFHFAVNMVVIRRSAISYDVISEPHKPSGILDYSHLSVRGLRADLRAPTISDSSIHLLIKRMAASERSGITLSSFTAEVEMSRDATSISNLSLSLPGSTLQFDDIILDSSPLVKNWQPLNPTPIEIALLPGAHIATDDLSPLFPVLSGLGLTAGIQLKAALSREAIDIDRFSLTTYGHGLEIDFKGSLQSDNSTDTIPATPSFSILKAERVNLMLDVPSTLSLLSGSSHPQLQQSAIRLAPLEPLGVLNLLGRGSAGHGHIKFDGSLTTSIGDIDFSDIAVSRDATEAPLQIAGRIVTANFNPSSLFSPIAPLTDLDLTADTDLTIHQSGRILGSVSLLVDDLIWQNTLFTDISANATFNGNSLDASIDSSNPGADFSVRGGGDLRGDNPLTQFYADLRSLRLSTFMPSGPLSDYTLSATVESSLNGRSPDTLTGWLNIDHLSLSPVSPSSPHTTGASASSSANRSMQLEHLSFSSSLNGPIRTIIANGDPLDLLLTGRFTFSTLSADITRLLAASFPSLFPKAESVDSDIDTDANLSLTLRPDSVFYSFFNLPVDIIYPVDITATTHSYSHTASINLSAPYLRQKDKLIESTALAASLNGQSRSSSLSAKSIIPTKNGPLDFRLISDGRSDSIITAINWTIDAPTTFSGDISLATYFSRSRAGDLLTDIAMHPGTLVFNDSLWALTPGSVTIAPRGITVHDIGAKRAGQSLAINGVAGRDSLQRIEVRLDHIDLYYVFSTLALSDAVNFGGIATGIFYGDALLSSNPILYTPRLHVSGITYNHCTFGDADIRSSWDNNSRSIAIHANIIGPEKNTSVIDGVIRPMNEMLDFSFTADRAPAGFMLPFMEAFTSQVDGFVSGKARLFGTFKDLDLTGDIFARDLSLRLDFTNTIYTVSDSVHIRPGEITFNDVTVHDRYGKTALLSGRVNHNYFHDPTFEFNITDARDLLVYDIREGSTSDPWYGTIFGNGGATVNGVPGKIDIDVKMATAPRSVFTFVLSDEEYSVEHDFVSFRDRDASRRDTIATLDPTPLIVRQLRDRVKSVSEGPPTVYDMKFDIGIDSLATLELIMDPAGGDKITAHGRGNLLMRYASDGDLTMHGEYTLTRGTYRFTLQDIIIKDFNILAGSRIRFLGDPYAAQLDLRAAHTIKANLTDLDESFADDRELTSTSVRVSALLNIRGDIRHPDLSFDLSFPTLTADTERKIRSIISTDEMMSQQILYLLALERFYTPEYMGATTHGGELVSVASSTLSSRLSSMLGLLSDRWTIAPTIRSDRGDFSDMQVDVALSSQLLDNRLLFNGNLGYRDKSLNNNSFIGDFDIRYLLNRSGTIQLKAYNRYNDQNYYLKSALTTQGVGIVFRRDFDNIFSFLRPLRRRLESSSSADSDSTSADSIRPDQKITPMAISDTILFAPDSIPTININVVPADK